MFVKLDGKSYNIMNILKFEPSENEEKQTRLVLIYRGGVTVDLPYDKVSKLITKESHRYSAQRR